jgi:hypothetical protein
MNSSTRAFPFRYRDDRVGCDPFNLLHGGCIHFSGVCRFLYQWLHPGIPGVWTDGRHQINAYVSASIPQTNSLLLDHVTFVDDNPGRFDFELLLLQRNVRQLTAVLPPKSVQKTHEIDHPVLKFRSKIQRNHQPCVVILYIFLKP